jgi:gluconolactonase
MKPDRPTSETSPTFHVQTPSFSKLLGKDPKVALCAENPSYASFHEAGVYIPSTGELFITSNLFVPPNGTSKTIRITKVGTRTFPYTCEVIEADVPMANGGINYQDHILFCAQGTLDRPGGLVVMERLPPYRTTNLIDGYFGRKFNSLNDVVVHSDGSIWFTDPCYGFEQNIRPPPELPNQIYRFDPESNDIRVMADGFDRPNGISFSPDEKVVYVTDTGIFHPPDVDLTRPRCMLVPLCLLNGPSIDADVNSYAFDLVQIQGQPSLTNRRLFAMADVGAPDGIKCDMEGNVYSGCGDGIHVWSAGGALLGKILIPGGVANFCFGPRGTIFALNEHRLWRVNLDKSVRGALLKL